jgi:flagellar motility protein MotE (MotC chaperone)
MNIQHLFFIMFRLINFVILIALFGHVFFKYFYHDLKNQVKKQLDWWLVLRDLIMSTRVKQKELDATIAHEEWETKRLLDNLARWRLHVQQEQQRKQHELVRHAHVVQEQRLLQEKNYEQQLLERQTTPLVFSKAQDILTATYDQNTPKASRFVDRMLKDIERAV